MPIFLNGQIPCLGYHTQQRLCLSCAHAWTQIILNNDLTSLYLLCAIQDQDNKDPSDIFVSCSVTKQRGPDSCYVVFQRSSKVISFGETANSGRTFNCLGFRYKHGTMAGPARLRTFLSLLGSRLNLKVLELLLCQFCLHPEKNI